MISRSPARACEGNDQVQICYFLVIENRRNPGLLSEDCLIIADVVTMVKATKHVKMKIFLCRMMGHKVITDSYQKTLTIPVVMTVMMMKRRRWRRSPRICRCACFRSSFYYCHDYRS